MKTIITRSDDCASSHAANQAIVQAVDAGFIKNVSIMAAGSYVEEAAQMLSGRKDICFGLHVTFNAEWDKVRWGPVSPKEQVPSLVDKDGFFYQDPVMFQDHQPSLDEMLRECDAQLDKLVRAGFSISYVDTHMFAESCITGWGEQLDRWIAAKGLVNHNFFYNFIPDNDAFAQTPGKFEQVLSHLGDGQYFFLSHPALYGQEMTQCGSADVDGEELARNRDREAAFVASPDTIAICERYGFRTIRYDEAVPNPDLKFRW
jgi:chitin disaccharide deacetylase